ncbi:MAG: hypothetical protein EXR71_03670 [Myxococcales bacterium]|nr:hypothetical protein [Myxococcales bacterium]
MKALGYVGAFAAGGVATVLIAAADPYAALDHYAQVVSDVDSYAAAEVPLASVVTASLLGIAAALDPHSAYFPPETWTKLRRQEAGLNLGIGATLVRDACGLRVDAVEPWGPAELVGVLPGDCIVGSEPTQFDGAAGTIVQFTLVRDGKQRYHAIVRAVAREPAVTTAVLNGVMVARVAHFHDPVVEPLVRAVPTRPPPRAMILDLRDNPGGQVDEAARLADRFLGSGTIVTVRQRAVADKIIVATPSRSDWTFPLVVLVDGDTASAAEITAGALRQLGRASLVGARTYGKGSVQRLFQYDDGSALKLTVGDYLLPDGNVIQAGAGLVPDEVVPRPTGALDVRSPLARRALDDPQLAAALARFTP